VEAGETDPLRERPLGEESQRLATGRGAQHPARVGGALATVESLDEFRAEPAQQQAGERHAHHFPLDDEGETGRQGRLQDDAVEVALVVRDQDAGAGWQAVRARHSEADAREPEEQRGTAAGDAAPHGHRRDRQRQDQRPDRKRQEHCPAPEAVHDSTYGFHGIRPVPGKSDDLM
jgi:hypothetical protein